MNPVAFFDFNPRQTVNQWLCIALLVSMCVWFVYFFVDKSLGVITGYYDSFGANALGDPTI